MRKALYIVSPILLFGAMALAAGTIGGGLTGGPRGFSGGSVSSFFSTGDGGVANQFGVGNNLEVKNNIDAGSVRTLIVDTTSMNAGGIDAGQLVGQTLSVVGASNLAGSVVAGSFATSGTANFSGATTIQLSAASPNVYASSSGLVLIESAASDANTSTSAAAISFKCDTDLTDGDLCINFKNSANTSLFKIDEQGFVTAATKIRSDQSSGQDAFLISTTGGRMRLANVGNAWLDGDGSGNNRSGATFLPSSNGSFDMGGTSNRWSTGYFNGVSSVTGTFTGLVSMTSNAGSCTLNGGTPSTCTATVTAGAKCQCTPVGTTAVIAAAGCAVSVSSTTLTATSGATLTNDVNYLCDR